MRRGNFHGVFAFRVGKVSGWRGCLGVAPVVVNLVIAFVPFAVLVLGYRAIKWAIDRRNRERSGEES